MSQADKQFNPAYLEDMSGGDSEFIAEILSTFVQTGRELLHGVQSAADQADVQKGLYSAHTLKGSARSIGAERFGELCERLEKCARANDMQAYTSLAAQVPGAFHALENEIAMFFRSKAA